MKIGRLVGLLTALALLAGGAVAQDDPYDNRWYMGVAGGLVFPDGNRRVEDDPGYQYGVNFGRFFTPSFSLDLRLDRYMLDYEQVTPGKSNRNRLQSYGLVGRYHFREGQDTRPYVLLGAGMQGHKNAYDKGRDIYASLGAGIHQTYTDNFSMRYEVEYRHDNDRDTFNRSSGSDDFLVTVGFNFALGAKPRAPEPAPAPEPVRTPPPAPAPAPRPAPEPEVVFEFDSSVTFGLNSAQLQPGAVAELNEAVALLNLHDELARVEVAGHTCDLGAADYNQGLSQRRAQAVRDYLVENGISADRLVVRGYGEDQPKVANRSESARQQNRRVELVVLQRRGR